MCQSLRKYTRIWVRNLTIEKNALSLSRSLLNCKISDVLAMDLHCLKYKTTQEGEKERWNSLLFVLAVFVSFHIAFFRLFALTLNHFKCFSVHCRWLMSNDTQPLLFSFLLLWYIRIGQTLLFVQNCIIFMRGNYEHVQDISLLTWVCWYALVCVQLHYQDFAALSSSRMPAFFCSFCKMFTSHMCVCVHPKSSPLTAHVAKMALTKMKKHIGY